MPCRGSKLGFCVRVLDAPGFCWCMRRTLEKVCSALASALHGHTSYETGFAKCSPSLSCLYKEHHKHPARRQNVQLCLKVALASQAEGASQLRVQKSSSTKTYTRMTHAPINHDRAGMRCDDSVTAVEQGNKISPVSIPAEISRNTS